MAQNELFDPDQMLRLTPEDTVQARERFETTGRQQGDSITDRFMDTAEHVIRTKLRSMNIDVEAEAREEDMDVDDYIREMDAFYELVDAFAHAYLEGMEDAFPFPIINS